MGTIGEERLFTFTLGNGRYCTAIGPVREVMRPVRLTHLPGARPGTLGLMNVRGKIIPVIDAAFSLLGARERDISTGLVLVVSSTHGEVGVLVDDLHGFIDCTFGDTGGDGVLPSPDTAEYGQPVMGVFERDEIPFTLINLNVLIENSTTNCGSAPACATP